MEFRTAQYERILKIFGDPDERMPPSIFLWGLSATGKSYVLQKALAKANIVHSATISAAEIMCGSRPFLESIIKQITGANGLTKNYKFSELMILVESFRLFFEKHRNEKVVIVIKEAEKLRKEHSDILQFLLTFHEVIENSNLSIVLCSRLPNIKYNFVPRLTNPTETLVVHFPQYTKDEMTQIISNSNISNSESFRPFTDYIVKNNFYKCADLRKLNRLAKSLWAEVAPEIKEFDAGCVHPKLRQIMKRKEYFGTHIVSNRGPNCFVDDGLTQRSIDIPTGSKYLLIAAYLASTNPVSSDTRFFTPGRSGKKRKTDVLKQVNTLQNAKIFPFARLVAIYCAVFNANVGIKNYAQMNDALRIQLSTLCKAKHIQCIPNERMAGCRYRCLLDYDTIRKISESVNLNIDRYLYSRI